HGLHDGLAGSGVLDHDAGRIGPLLVEPPLDGLLGNQVLQVAGEQVRKRHLAAPHVTHQHGVAAGVGHDVRRDTGAVGCLCRLLPCRVPRLHAGNGRVVPDAVVYVIAATVRPPLRHEYLVAALAHVVLAFYEERGDADGVDLVL